MKRIPLFYDPGFAAPIGEHIMPMHKFAMVAEALSNEPSFELCRPSPAEIGDLQRVHTDDYVSAIRDGVPLELAESQKFSWSPALFPSVRLTNGAVVDAAARALDGAGIAGALASGFHHARADRGEGFCTFNGLVVALERLATSGRIRKAAILDLDLHYGNGTATLAESRDWLFALSIYGNDYWDNRAYADVETVRHPSGPNHRSRALPNGCTGPRLLEILEDELPRLIQPSKPDLLLYQAGADPLRDDPYSPLDLSHDDLLARDRCVFQFARHHEIPVAWTLAGGYTPDTSKVVRVHANTARVAAQVYLNT